MVDSDHSIATALAELSTKIEILLEKHEELADNVSKIKEMVYNPDSGLFARMRELEVRIQGLEEYRNTNVRILWMVATSIIGLAVATGWKIVF